MKIEKIETSQILNHLEEIGNLRIEVFREFPYLYEGNLDYEIKYLSRYARSQTGAIFLVWDQKKLVGASSCMALKEEEKEFQGPFHDSDIDEVFYFGESILLPSFRGKGIGKEFFKLRENHALETLGSKLKITTFCAVDRPKDHPKKPINYQSPEGLWLSRGYEKQSNLQAKFSWPEIGSSRETEKTLTFWTKLF